jgi:hypothetical protein
MTARAGDSRAASENLYRSLRVDFEATYKKMTDASKEFTAVLMNVGAELSPEQRRARTAIAAQAYQDAHERFTAAVRKLNAFMISHIVASRSTIHLVPPQR